MVIGALQKVRYLAHHQHDGNVTRQQLHPIWKAAQGVSKTELIEHKSELDPNQIIEIERALAVERYASLCVGNGIGLGVSSGLDNEDIAENLPKLAADYIATAIRGDNERFEKSVQRARTRLHFIEDKLGN